MKKRLFYEAPETELFVVRFEENILSGGDTPQGSLKFGGSKHAGADPEYENAGEF